MWDGRLTPGVVVYMSVAGALVILSLLGAASIGYLLIPVPITMFLALVVWPRRAVVAGLVGAAAAWSVSYVLTVPGWRFERSSVSIGPAEASAGLRGCRSMVLPAVPLERCDEAHAQALLLAFGAAAVVGGVAAAATRVIERAVRRPTAETAV